MHFPFYLIFLCCLMPTILDRKGAQALVYFLFFGTVTKGLLFSIFTKANATTD
jgi:hypothetical protein